MNYRCKVSYFIFIYGTSTLIFFHFPPPTPTPKFLFHSHQFNAQIVVFLGPKDVKDVEVIEQTETTITLKWEKVDNISTYALHYHQNGSMKEENATSSPGTSITHVIARLTAATKYKFTIITQLEGATSTGYSVEAVTSKRDQIYHFKAFLFVKTKLLSVGCWI